MEYKYGLLGKNISYSFSRKYFAEKFSKLELSKYSYENFDIPEIEEFPNIIKSIPHLKGFNVTIPYKESILPYIDKLSKKAKKIGAINCVKVTKKGTLKGYNTDWYGFKKSLEPLLQSHNTKALILGTGGASKAVAFTLEQLNIDFKYVSRQRTTTNLQYEDLNEAIFQEYTIIINCTPIGTFPTIDACPALPYEHFSAQHIAYDLIYNPEETTFLKIAKEKGATIKNGYDMLVFQAEKAWEIWNK